MKVLLVFGAELQRDTEQTHRRSCWYIRNSRDSGPTKAAHRPGHSLKKSPETDTSGDSQFAQWQIAVKVPIERQFQRRCSAKPRSPLRTSTLCN